MPITSFSDFSGGEFGDLGPTGAKPNQFTGRNVMVYKDGSVGPRPGLRQATVVGTSTSVGALWACGGIGSADTNSRVLVGQGQLVKRLNPLDATAGFLTTGTVSITVTLTTQINQVGPSIGVMPVYGDKVYSVDGATPPVPLASSPAAGVASAYGARIMAANTATSPNRVYYSAAITATQVINATFPALNFFDVGLASWPITLLTEQRQRLAIANQGGEFWGESGVPGVNDVLRRQPRGDVAPFAWYHTVRIGESIWFLPNGEDFPVEFTGATTDKLRLDYLRFTGGLGTEFVGVGHPVNETVLFCQVGGSNYALMHANKTWSYQTFGVATRFATPLTLGGLGADYDNPLLLSDGGSSSAAPSFYFFQPSLDRPAKTGDTYAQPGDGSNTPVTANLYTHYWWAPTDRDIKVTEVTVDGFTWNTGSSSTNHCAVTVRSLFRYGNTAYADSTAQSFDEAASLTTSDKTDKRFRATNPDAPAAQGFQIRLDNLRGFAVRRIRVEYVEGSRR